MFNMSFNRFYLSTVSSVSSVSFSALTLLLAACGGGGAGEDIAQADSAVSQSSLLSSENVSTQPGVSPSTAPAANSANTSNTANNASSDDGGDDSGTAPVPFGQDASRYTLTFQDEFENGFNTSVWNDRIWYEASNPTKNYTVENGALKIWPQRDASGKFFNRTIDTDGKYYQTYGYYEIEAKLPRGKGTWPAFWLFNHIGSRRPEIDVMESYAGGPAPWGVKNADGVAIPTMYAVTIWKDAKTQAGFQKIAAPDLSSSFHKYALKWEPNKQTFYFDGKEVYSVNVTMPDRMYLMLDLWYGSASGTPDNSTPTGKANSYEVKYIRAWKFK